MTCSATQLPTDLMLDQSTDDTVAPLRHAGHGSERFQRQRTYGTGTGTDFETQLRINGLSDILHFCKPSRYLAIASLFAPASTLT